MGKKHERKRERLETMEFSTTPAQRLMRQEMEAGVHKAPQALGSVLDEVVGAERPDVTAEVKQKAYAIINNGPQVQLTLKQWTAVQSLVEEGILVGMGL